MKKICVFCEKELREYENICKSCNDYKGILKIDSDYRFFLEKYKNKENLESNEKHNTRQ